MDNVIDIIKHLNNDKIKNISIINFIENYNPDYAEIIGEDVLLRGESDRKWVYISSKGIKDFNQIINKLNSQDKCFAMIEDWMLPLLTKGKKIKWILSCIRVVLKKEIKINPKIGGETLLDEVKLSIEDADYIFANSDYKEFTSIQYIKDRIKNGISVGLKDSGRLVAWAMTHDDGAIGFVNVINEYRGNGYGQKVATAIINSIVAEGKIPFACIEEDNLKSMSMFKKLGFSEDRKIHWFEIE